LIVIIAFTGQRTQRNGRNRRNALKATDGTTDVTSDHHFDTPSFIINILIVGRLFCLNIVLIAIYFCSFTLIMADDQNSFRCTELNCKSRRPSIAEGAVDNY